MSGARKKILFVAEAATLAHAARMSVLCRGLDSDQFETRLAVDPRYNSLFPELEGRRVEVATIAGSEFVSRLAKGQPLYSYSELKDYVEDDLRLLDEWKPDVVVGDFRLSLSVSARLRQVPYVSLSNVYWGPGAVTQYPIPAHPLVGVFGLAIAQQLFSAVRPFAFAYHTLPLNRLRRFFGLPALGFDLSRVYTDCDQLLFADIPELFPDFKLAPNQGFIGPVLWSPEQEVPEWWEQLDDSKPCIYVTMGSSGDEEVLSGVIGAVKDLDTQILVATAGRGQPEQRQDNIFCANFLPGRRAVERASVVICNGGSLTTYECLKAGVPVVGVASNLDQHLNMGAVERLRAGLYQRSDTLDRTAIKGFVGDCLGGSQWSVSGEVRAHLARSNPTEALREHLLNSG